MCIIGQYNVNIIALQKYKCSYQDTESVSIDS